MEISTNSICKYKNQVLITFEWILENISFCQGNILFKQNCYLEQEISVVSNSGMIAYVVIVFVVINAITYLKTRAVAGFLNLIRDRTGYTLQAQFFHENKSF